MQNNAEREQFPVGTVLVSTPPTRAEHSLLVWKSQYNGWRVTAIDGAILDDWYKDEDSIWDRVEQGILEAVHIPPETARS